MTTSKSLPDRRRLAAREAFIPFWWDRRFWLACVLLALVLLLSVTQTAEDLLGPFRTWIVYLLAIPIPFCWKSMSVDMKKRLGEAHLRRDVCPTCFGDLSGAANGSCPHDGDLIPKGLRES